MGPRNLLADIPVDLPDELFEELLRGESFLVERIVSRGHATPAGQWYDQERDEWVVVLRGRAGLTVEGTDGVVSLGPGDALLLPAHRRHRVEWTAAGEETVWLAIHFRSTGARQAPDGGDAE